MSQIQSMAQAATRGKRGKARDVAELEALETAQAAMRQRLVADIRQEWESFVTAEAHRDAEGRLIWSERLIRSLADTGLATLRYLAQGGDREAARLLVDRLLGEPDLPFEEKVKQMDEGRAMAQIEEILGRTKLSDPVIDGLLQVFKAPPPPALPEGDKSGDR